MLISGKYFKQLSIFCRWRVQCEWERNSEKWRRKGKVLEKGEKKREGKWEEIEGKEEEGGGVFVMCVCDCFSIPINQLWQIWQNLLFSTVYTSSITLN